MPYIGESPGLLRIRCFGTAGIPGAQNLFVMIIFLCWCGLVAI